MFSLIPNRRAEWLPVERDINEAFQRFFQGDLATSEATFSPRVNVVDSESSLRVTAELPGVEEKDIQVSLTSDGLTLSGEKKLETEEKGKGFYRLERSFGSFKRLIPLPEEVDREKVEATYKKGVLTITLPKRADSAPKKIDIKGE